MHILRVKCQLRFPPIATNIVVAQQFLTKILKKKIFQELSGFYMRTDGKTDF